MVQRLAAALAQVKACNTTENLINEIRQLIKFLYQENQLNERVYNNIVNSMNL